jgi:hypothetical protein
VSPSRSPPAIGEKGRSRCSKPIAAHAQRLSSKTRLGSRVRSAGESIKILSAKIAVARERVPRHIGRALERHPLRLVGDKPQPLLAYTSQHFRRYEPRPQGRHLQVLIGVEAPPFRTVRDARALWSCRVSVGAGQRWTRRSAPLAAPSPGLLSAAGLQRFSRLGERPRGGVSRRGGENVRARQRLLRVPADQATMIAGARRRGKAPWARASGGSGDRRNPTRPLRCRHARRTQELRTLETARAAGISQVLKTLGRPPGLRLLAGAPLGLWLALRNACGRGKDLRSPSGADLALTARQRRHSWRPSGARAARAFRPPGRVPIATACPWRTFERSRYILHLCLWRSDPTSALGSFRRVLDHEAWNPASRRDGTLPVVALAAACRRMPLARG